MDGNDKNSINFACCFQPLSLSIKPIQLRNDQFLSHRVSYSPSYVHTTHSFTTLKYLKLLYDGAIIKKASVAKTRTSVQKSFQKIIIQSTQNNQLIKLNQEVVLSLKKISICRRDILINGTLILSLEKFSRNFTMKQFAVYFWWGHYNRPKLDSKFLIKI